MNENKLKEVICFKGRSLIVCFSLANSCNSKFCLTWSQHCRLLSGAMKLTVHGEGPVEQGVPIDGQRTVRQRAIGMIVSS